MFSEKQTADTVYTYEEKTDSTQEFVTDCCIVGGGPAGIVLALLLARQGISVILLELHKDFERSFRGDTLHPSVMEIMDELGLAEKLLALPHSKLHRLVFQTSTADIPVADFSQLKTKYPYITVLPQVKFLELLAAEISQYPKAQVIMGANVTELVETEGIIRGIRYRKDSQLITVTAKLVIGADGRFSKLRQLGGFEAVETGAPMDVLWFRLPRLDSDEHDVGLRGRIGSGHMLAIIERYDYWQLGYVILKGSYQSLRHQGIEQFQLAIEKLAPEFSQRVQQLKDWSSIAFLSVKSDRLKRWYRPGLLLIGDAAHIMSPVAGVGINYAITDAVVTANILSEPLQRGEVSEKQLKKVQEQRQLPVRIIQQFQSLVQQQIIKNALTQQQAFKPPIFLRLPIIRKLLARLVAFGIPRAHLQQ